MACQMNDRLAASALFRIREHYKNDFYISAIDYAVANLKDKSTWVESFQEDRPFCKECKHLCPQYKSYYDEIINILTPFCPHCGARMTNGNGGD